MNPSNNFGGRHSQQSREGVSATYTVPTWDRSNNGRGEIAAAQTTHGPGGFHQQNTMHFHFPSPGHYSMDVNVNVHHHQPTHPWQGAQNHSSSHSSSNTVSRNHNGIPAIEGGNSNLNSNDQMQRQGFQLQTVSSTLSTRYEDRVTNVSSYIPSTPEFLAQQNILNRRFREDDSAYCADDEDSNYLDDSTDTTLSDSPCLK